METTMSSVDDDDDDEYDQMMATALLITFGVKWEIQNALTWGFPSHETCLKWEFFS